jgi:hypothetical protein
VPPALLDCERWVCIYLDWLATYRNLSLIPDPVWFRISSLYAAQLTPLPPQLPLAAASSASAAARCCLRAAAAAANPPRLVPCQQVFLRILAFSSSTRRLGAGRSKVTCVHSRRYAHTPFEFLSYRYRASKGGLHTGHLLFFMVLL